MKGVYIGGVNVNNLRYADDTVLIAGPMFLQALLIAVNEKGKPYSMEMNITVDYRWHIMTMMVFDNCPPINVRQFFLFY